MFGRKDEPAEKDVTGTYDKTDKIDVTGISDKPAEKDRLGCKKYYKGIADFILHCETPMTIAIEGDWGSGKTTAMNNIKTYLCPGEKSENKSENESCIIIEYNAWRYSKYDTDKLDVTCLNMGLYSELCAACKENIRFKSFLNRFIDNTGNGATIASGVIGGEASAEAAAVLADGIKNKFFSIAKILQHIKEIASRQAINDKRIVIFVDDLDRLRPEAAVDFLEYIKLFMDCEGIVFVLAVDFDVVCRGVKAKYGDDMEGTKARQFFDKIIQLPFEVPVIQYEIKGIVEDCLNTNDEKILERYVKVIKDVVGNNKNPRTIKRAFNMHSLYLNIMENENSKDPDISKMSNYKFYLFVIELLQVVQNDRYKKMLEMAQKNSLTSDSDDETLIYLKKLLTEEELWDFIKVLSDYVNVFAKSDYDRFKEFQDKMMDQQKHKLNQTRMGNALHAFFAELEKKDLTDYDVSSISDHVTYTKGAYKFIIRYSNKNKMDKIIIEVSDNYDTEQLIEKGVHIEDGHITHNNPSILGFDHIVEKKIFRFHSVITYIENNEGSLDTILDWLLRK